MTDLLIRNLSDTEHSLLSAAAKDTGVGVAAFAREAALAHARAVRRRERLTQIEARLQGTPPVSEKDRKAVLDAIDASYKVWGATAQVGARDH